MPENKYEYMKQSKNCMAASAAPAEKQVSPPSGKIDGQGKPKDSATSSIFKKNHNFAEVFNRTLFTECPVLEEELVEQDIKETTLLRVTEDAHTTLTQYRDVVKGVKREQILAILGIENQELQDYQMAFRALEMDFINYARQIREISEQHTKEYRRRKQMRQSETERDPLSAAEEEVSRMSLPDAAGYLGRFYKEDRIVPCITLVIYWGEEPWQGPRKLSDLFIESEWSALASDYQMHLLEVKNISENSLAEYSPELRAIFGFVKYANDKNLLHTFMDKNRDDFKTVSETALDAIEVLTHSKDLKNAREKKLEEIHSDRGLVLSGENSMDKAGGTNMANAIDELFNDLREEGIEKGIEQGIEQGREEQRVFTERERQRAEAAEQRVSAAERMAEAAERKAAQAEQIICELQARLALYEASDQTAVSRN